MKRQSWLTLLLFVLITFNLTAIRGVLAELARTSLASQGDAVRYGTLSNGTAPRLVVASDDVISGFGVLRAMSVSPPWQFQTPPLEIGLGSIVRSTAGRLYVVSRTEGTITVIDPGTWTPLQDYSLGAASEPLDIAVVSPQLGYVTRRTATHLLRLDLVTGASAEVVDLGIFADDDGVPDLGMMVAHEGRLFVQIRRWNFDEPWGYVHPSYLAVVDIASEQIIDVDPDVPGLQAIALQGTPPKLKMQIVRQTRRLFVSATGDFFDDGGIEMIDLDTLQSVGMAVSEYDNQLGADAGAFVMVTPERGFLTSSTDLILSSHLVSFTVSGSVEAIPDPYVSLEYYVPTLVHAAQTGVFFYPEGGYGDQGVHVFDALTGIRLTNNPIATSGPPTDLVLFSAPRAHRTLRPQR